MVVSKTINITQHCLLEYPHKYAEFLKLTSVEDNLHKFFYSKSFQSKLDAVIKSFVSIDKSIVIWLTDLVPYCFDMTRKPIKKIPSQHVNMLLNYLGKSVLVQKHHSGC